MHFILIFVRKDKHIKNVWIISKERYVLIDIIKMLLQVKIYLNINMKGFLNLADLMYIKSNAYFCMYNIFYYRYFLFIIMCNIFQ